MLDLVYSSSLDKSIQRWLSSVPPLFIDWFYYFGHIVYIVTIYNIIKQVLIQIESYSVLFVPEENMIKRSLAVIILAVMLVLLLPGFSLAQEREDESHRTGLKAPTERQSTLFYEKYFGTFLLGSQMNQFKYDNYPWMRI